MRNKKGFTVIEMMAVVIILGVIALISVPIYHFILGRMRKSIFTKSATGLLKTTKMNDKVLESGQGLIMTYSMKDVDLTKATSIKAYAVNNSPDNINVDNNN